MARLTATLRRKVVLVALGLGAVLVAIGLTVALTGASGTHDAEYYRGSVVAGGDDYPYLVFVPASYRRGSAVPLLVVLHGCDTTADQQAIASGYAPLAERRRFIVLYPDVDPADFAHGQCWKGIWDPAAEARGRGDARAIAAMTAAVMRNWRIDHNRVYAIGISAGGFETSIIGADYPDLFAAIGIHSGAAYGGGQPGCLAAGQSPAATASLARAALAAMGPRARAMPVIVFQGDQDQVIPYRCGAQAVQQWLDTANLALVRAGRRPAIARSPVVRSGTVPHGHAYTVTTYFDRRACPLAELWTVHGMGHAWSGGSSDPSIARYTDPLGPSAATASVSFFLRWSLDPSEQPPPCA